MIQRHPEERIDWLIVALYAAVLIFSAAFYLGLFAAWKLVRGW